VAGQDWFEKDFYATLGVAKDADGAAIKKAYRKLARTHHPDSNGGKDARFKEIGEAYSVLSDAEQRKQYDAIRTMSGGGARFAPGAGAGSSAGFEDLLGDLFGGAGAGGQRGSGQRVRYPSGGAGTPDLEDLLGGMFGQGGQGFSGYGAPAGPRKGADVNASTRIGFREAVLGSTVTLRSPDGGTVTARIPAGVRDGQRIRLRGKGSAGEAGPGDLMISVTVEPHPVFTRTGDDLALTLPVTFGEAALGAQVEVPTLDGSVQMKIPAGTPSGRTLRLKGRGITNGSHTGDLRVSVQVVVPQRLDDDARAAVQAYAEATSDDDPRAEFAHRARG